MRSCLSFAGIFLACLLASLRAAPHPATINVRDHGAIADGRTKNTLVLQRVINDCAAAGGATVHFPAGRYLTGSLQLQSNITLHLDPGAELLYSGDPADSPLVPSRWECTNVFTHAPLLYANGAENITITGRGIINGQGENWWWRNGYREPGRAADIKPARDAWLALFARIEAGEQPAASDFTVAAGYLRPSLIGIYNSKNILVEGVTITNSPMWMLHPVYSDDIAVRGVRFISEGPNGDGMDVDSCRNVRISDCFFSTEDDCIVIKSGRNADGRRTARPTEHVTITNCVMYRGHGAVVIGSETAGDIRNITASNCVSKGTHVGIRLKSMRGRGGVMENFRFDNWVIEDAQLALGINSRYNQAPEEPRSERTPTFRNIAYSNITVVNAQVVARIVGIPEQPIEHVRFSDIDASGKTGFIVEDAVDLELHHVRVNARTGPAFSFANARDLALDDLASRTPQQGEPVLLLKHSEDIWLRSTRAFPGTDIFLRCEGPAPQRLKLTDSDLSAATTPVSNTKPARSSDRRSPG